MQILSNILITLSIFLLIANSYSLIYYTTKFFHIAHAVVISSGAYFVFLFANKFSIHFTVSVALAIVSATILGASCEVFVYRQMRKRNVHTLAYLIASIGLYVVLQNCTSLFFGDDPKIISISECNTDHP